MTRAGFPTEQIHPGVRRMGGARLGQTQCRHSKGMVGGQGDRQSSGGHFRVKTLITINQCLVTTVMPSFLDQLLGIDFTLNKQGCLVFVGACKHGHIRRHTVSNRRQRATRQYGTAFHGVKRGNSA